MTVYFSYSLVSGVPLLGTRSYDHPMDTPDLAELSKAIALRWPGDSQRESGRFARIDSQKTPYFHNVRAVRANGIKPAIRKFWPPEARFAQKGVLFGNPDTIRKNQAIRANLRIDSRESGHLS